jgi:hypothetical protein
MQSCDHDLSSGFLCTGETTDGDYARIIEWWWVRVTNFIVYVSGMQDRLQESKQKHNAKYPKSKSRKYAATDVFHAT